MRQPRNQEPLTVLYDGACPLCRREIAHVQGLADRRGDTGLTFLDISSASGGDQCSIEDREKLLARFHVQRPDGSRLDGAAAFVEMWRRLPGWRWLALIARVPGGLAFLETLYRGFLRIRPSMQRMALGSDRRG